MGLRHTIFEIAHVSRLQEGAQLAELHKIILVDYFRSYIVVKGFTNHLQEVAARISTSHVLRKDHYSLNLLISSLAGEVSVKEFKFIQTDASGETYCAPCKGEKIFAGDRSGGGELVHPFCDYR